MSVVAESREGGLTESEGKLMGAGQLRPTVALPRHTEEEQQSIEPPCAALCAATAE